MEIYILIGIVIFLFIITVMAFSKYEYYKEQYESQIDTYNYYKNKISMIEYQYRNYREGKNPFTVLRKIGDIIQDYHLKQDIDKENDD